MQKALTVLGYPLVYHTRTVLARQKDGDKWAELLERKFEGKGPISEDEWDELLGEFSVGIIHVLH